jgi:hypothetical protein
LVTPLEERKAESITNVHLEPDDKYLIDHLAALAETASKSDNAYDCTKVIDALDKKGRRHLLQQI